MDLVIPDYNYIIIKINLTKLDVSFIECPDFDKEDVHFPIIKSSFKINAVNSCKTKPRNDGNLSTVFLIKHL